MTTHIYKGCVLKSLAMTELLLKNSKSVGFIYYDESRPYPQNIENVLMVNRKLDILSFVIGIEILADEGYDYFVIYTNYTEQENAELIEALQDSECSDRVIAVVMCNI